MSKRWIIGVGVVVGLFLLGGLGMWYRQSHYRVDDSTSAGGVRALDGNSQTPSVPISADDQKPPEGSLQVSTRGVGQIDLGQAASDRSNSSSREEGANDFTQYDKYKEEQSALFGEIVVGTGPEALAGKKLTINYRGWLTDGRMFDDSYAKGQPLTFVPGEHKVITGLEQGILGMRVGGKRRLIVPPAVGYGAEGKSPIPANAVMVFDIELVGAQ